MQTEHSSGIAAPLSRHLGADADAAQIADATVAAWQEIDAALSPIIGAAGVAALYKRSLYLTSSVHPWLASAHEAAGSAIDLAPLKSHRPLAHRAAAAQRVGRANIGVLIDEAAHACRPAMHAGLQLGVFVPGCPLTVDGDQIRLRQVLCNLLDNASKYTQVGGEIGLSVTAVDDVIVITVSDNGIGITAAALPEVFEPFIQDRHAIGFNGEGLGIGLTVVRELVQAHGGQVVASSAGTGFGSQFVVTLPLVGAAADGAQTAA